MTMSGVKTSSLELRLEALLLAAPEAISLHSIYEHADQRDVLDALDSLKSYWNDRGMRIEIKGDFVSMIPAAVYSRILAEKQGEKARVLSSAAVETLCFIAVHQPVSIADIEKARGLKLFKGVIDSLLDVGLIRASVRRTDAGRAVAYVTTDMFLEHFGLSSLSDLPTAEEIIELGKPFSDE